MSQVAVLRTPALAAVAAVHAGPEASEHRRRQGADARPVLAVAIGQHSEAGRKALNQDFHGVCVPTPPTLESKGIVLALADGIGSSQVSHEASQAAVRAVLEDYYATPDAWSVKRAMQRVLTATNSWLHAQTQRGVHRHDAERGHVCAVAVLVLKGRTAHLFHAGDVRILRLRGDTVEPLTEDHRVWVGGGQHYLSRALGFQPHLELDYRNLPLERGDCFVLACDGVHEHLSADAMQALVRQHADDPQAAARALVGAAFANGSDDNLTAQVLQVQALPEAELSEAQQRRAALPLPPVLAPRTVFDGYRIERELHASHRSHVYLATDLDNGERVVLKTPSVDLAQDETALDRFMMEEWIARRVRSTHVLQPRGRSRTPSHLYVAMEYVEGITLAQWMRDHPAPDLPTVRGIVEQTARGLQAFHRLEMVHRDLRPENIMIDRAGTVKIIDFGSVRVAGLADRAMPGTGEPVLGMVQYTAPECFLGEPASERSDLFSLGVIAYQMLSGRLPYGIHASAVRTRADAQRLTYESVIDDRRAVPAWVDAVLARAVHPEPRKRHEALSALVQELREPGAAALGRERVPLIERHPLRFWRALSAALALVALAQAAVLVSLHQRPTSPNPVKPSAMEKAP